MRNFNYIFVVVFLVFAALQYNDPDPYLWIPIYLYAAILCYGAAKRRINPGLYVVGFVALAGYAVYLFFEETGVLNWATQHGAENIAQSMKAAKPWIEATREFGGLAIVLIVMTLNYFWLRRRGKQAAR